MMRAQNGESGAQVAAQKCAELVSSSLHPVGVDLFRLQQCPETEEERPEFHTRA